MRPRRVSLCESDLALDATVAQDLIGYPMLRNMTASGAKTVFLAEAFDGISANDPDPNNTKVLLSRIIEWLEPDHTADVKETHPTPRSAILDIRPNPFNPATRITFSLSARGAEGPARLDVFDVAGRHIASLFDGIASPGEHTVAWNGRPDAGDEIGGGIRSGTYLARLATCEGSTSRKLILLK